MGGIRGLLAQPGPLARSVADLALMLPVIAGPDGHDPTVVPMPVDSSATADLTSMRVAYYTDNGIMPATPETVAAVQAAVQVLADAGATVTEDRPDGIAQTMELFLGLNASDGGAGVQRSLQMAGTETPHPATRGFLETIQPMATLAAEFLGPPSPL
jgi:amidase